MNYEALGTVLSIDWTRKDLQKGKIKKIDGLGPEIITFFRPLCDKSQLVVLGKEYEYNLQDIDPELEILNDLRNPLKECLDPENNDLLDAVLFSYRSGPKKKVAVDLEEH